LKEVGDVWRSRSSSTRHWHRLRRSGLRYSCHTPINSQTTTARLCRGARWHQYRACDHIQNITVFADPQAQEQRTIIIAAKAVAKKRDATHALDKCIATIIQKKLGSHRPPTDAEVERFDDDVLSPFRERLRKLNIDDTPVAEAVEYYRYQLVEASLRRIPEGDAIISDPQSGLKPQVREALANARHWIGRHTSEKNLNKEDVIENEKLRLESTMLGRSDPLKTLLLEEMRKTNEDNYVPISDIDLQAISDKFFIKKPNAP
jgi:hypothetical protein